MKKYIMSIDQGTTGSTVILVDQGGSLVASSDCDFKQIYPKAGWVEHDPKDIWSSVETSLKNLFKKSKIKPQQISAVGITNQRETIIAWRKSNSKILNNAIVWQCRRTAKMCDQLRPKWQSVIKAKTGLVLDPYFSASKIRWLIENSKDVQKALADNDLAFGTIDTYLMWKLSNGKIFATDVSNASRTMLMNLETLNWDTELLKIFKVPISSLPEIKSSAGLFGLTSLGGSQHLISGLPIAGVAGDQQAALFGQACFQAGESKCTFGTGSFILINSGSKIIRSKFNLLTTVAWKIKDQPAQYALEGGAFICGAAIQWLRDGLGIIKTSEEVEILASQVQHSLGVEFVPALTGLGAPHWNSEARGVISGLTRGSTKNHIARATLEAMALQNADILNCMQKDLKKKIKILRVDGGASANNLLMQLQADYLQTQVDRPKLIETTAMGAAFLAGLGVSHWQSVAEIKKIFKLDRSFKPKLSRSELKLRQKSWDKALARAVMK